MDVVSDVLASSIYVSRCPITVYVPKEHHPPISKDNADLLPPNGDCGRMNRPFPFRLSFPLTHTLPLSLIFSLDFVRSIDETRFTRETVQ